MVRKVVILRVEGVQVVPINPVVGTIFQAVEDSSQTDD